MVIKNYTFEAEPVLMDYHDFRHCTFKKCRLIFCGYSAVVADSCRFEDCRWEFGGPAFATLQFLATLHQGGSEMGKAIVQQAIAIIQQPPAAAPATPATRAATPVAAPATPAAPAATIPAPALASVETRRTVTDVVEVVERTPVPPVPPRVGPAAGSK